MLVKVFFSISLYFSGETRKNKTSYYILMIIKKTHKAEREDKVCCKGGLGHLDR